jgi:UDP-N-acetylglucosamine--dolichyl-phosphate N-acetylglucosaminephosphotransferase
MLDGFPRAIDFHKKDRRKTPNSLGIVYVFSSVTYLFLLSPLRITGSLTLACCVLFGGFLGLVDDLIDLKWRYKSFLPLFASLPLIALREITYETKMATYFFGKIDFGIYYYILIIPLIITIVTNTVNQLGGLNGLETICPVIIIAGLALVSPQERMLLYIPILACFILAFFNYRGRIFIGNTGSFALGITIASYSIIANIEQTLLISIIPYILNSILILLNYFIFHNKASLTLKDNKIISYHRRSLQTLIAYNRLLTEKQIVQIISIIMMISTISSIFVWLIW